MNQKYHVIGLMSGTSLDGVDIAYCEFEFENKWSVHLLFSETISYDVSWKNILEKIHEGSAEKISETDCLYGNFLGNLVSDFCNKYKIVPDFISSHGHTVFHQPGRGFTRQIGSGAHLSVSAGFPVICDFRSADVAMGGQGAPLVPVGDKLLFGEFDFCLNLGGISNISFDKNGKRLAFDISPCNLVLNFLALQRGRSFDENGDMAASGKINIELLEKLNQLSYYSKPFPKSLGREDVEKNVLPLIKNFSIGIEDALATFCEHVAIQIAAVVGTGTNKRKLLLTGGGALNTFLVKRIFDKCSVEVVVPERKIIEYKEAIIFAFLGVLRMRGEINCLKSVTGAKWDSCSGAIYHPSI